jgi:hypothetical protein
MKTPSETTDGQRHTSFSAKRANGGILLLLIICCGLSVLVGGLSVQLVLSSRNRRRPSSSSRISIFSPLPMAKPGQSEEQAKQERENDIRSKIASLKKAGKFKKSNPEESMMAEGEKFFNQESPLRKFERRKKERELREQQEQEANALEDDSSSANTTTN